MKKVNIIALGIVIAVLLSVGVLSQISPIISTMTKATQVTSDIWVQEKDTCTTEFFDEVQDTYGSCIYYNNYTSCLNTTGPNTGCSLNQATWNFQCKTGEVTTVKNVTECRPNDEFVIAVFDKGTAVLKKQLDFSEWGPCIYEEQNSCLIVTCVSLYDGAHKGQFTDCNGGKSCQKFEICDGSIKTFYKNSREGFVADDPSFYLNKLALKEVQE